MFNDKRIMNNIEYVTEFMQYFLIRFDTDGIKP